MAPLREILILLASLHPVAAGERLAVVVRTQEDLFIGEDLRFADGRFRVRYRGRDVELAEADVARATWLRPQRRAAALNPGLGMAFRLVKEHRLQVRPGAFVEGIFLLPDDPLPQTFAWMAPKVEQTDLLALLCIDVAAQSIRQKKPGLAAAIFEGASAEETVPARRFVFAVMRAAVLIKQERRVEAEEALIRLLRDFPQYREELLRLRMLLRRPEPTP